MIVLGEVKPRYMELPWKQASSPQRNVFGETVEENLQSERKLLKNIQNVRKVLLKIHCGVIMESSATLWPAYMLRIRKNLVKWLIFLRRFFPEYWRYHSAFSDYSTNPGRNMTWKDLLALTKHRFLKLGKFFLLWPWQKQKKWQKDLRQNSNLWNIQEIAIRR